MSPCWRNGHAVSQLCELDELSSVERQRLNLTIVDDLEDGGVGTNVIHLAPHNAIRSAVMKTATARDIRQPALGAAHLLVLPVRRQRSKVGHADRPLC